MAEIEKYAKENRPATKKKTLAKAFFDLWYCIVGFSFAVSSIGLC